MSDLTMRLQAQLANNPLAARWHALPPRDRLALGLLGGFLLLVLLYLLLYPMPYPVLHLHRPCH